MIAMNVLLSLGSAVKIGYKKGTALHEQKTCYLMMDGECNAGCLYCIRATNKNKLSRIPWYSYDLEGLIPDIESKFERICIQSVNHNNLVSEIKEIISNFSNSIPISVSISLKDYKGIEKLYGHADKIGIGLDCARKDIFEKVKPYYKWDKTWESLEKVSEIFGDYNVICHLICGLGEAEQDMISTFQKLFNFGVYPSLFSFTPIKGTKYEKSHQPNIESYRRLQLAHYLITSNIRTYEDMTFQEGKVLFDNHDLSHIREEVFITRGCPSCDRPFYNESPKETIYNYPNQKMVDLIEIKTNMINHKIY